MRWTGRLLAVLVLGAAVAGCGCSRDKTATAAAKNAASERAVAVTVAEAEGRDVQRSIQIVGTLLPQEEVTLANEVPATVDKIFVDLGDRVRRGQVLIKLDEREARLEVGRQAASLQAAREALQRARQVLDLDRANLERNRALLADAQVNLKRYQGLYAEGAISASQRDSAQTQHDVALASLRGAEAQLESDRAAVKNAEAGVEQASAALELARKRLRDTDVVSPLDGFVRKRFVNPGETFKEKTPLLSLVATRALKLQGDVPERFAPLVAVGHPVQVEVEAYPDRRFAGRIVRVSPSVDTETRTFTVEAAIPNTEGRLKPGFFAKAALIVGTDRAVPFVPEDAVASFAGIVKVFVITGGKAEERRVKTGQRRDGWAEILEGVKVGETVATSNLSQLATGTPVQVRSGTGAGPRNGNQGGATGGPGERPARPAS